MGYTTEFSGKFNLNKPLSPAHADYLRAFSRTRRMKRDAEKTARLPDPVRKMVELPVGTDGEFFVGSPKDFGQERTPDIAEYNYPPSTQPSLWCQWVPSEDRLHIEWDGNEKFSDYVEWLQYLIDSFLTPWGYKLTGEVRFQGEADDIGVVSVRGGIVSRDYDFPY